MIRSAGVRASCPVDEVPRISGGRACRCRSLAFSLVELLLVISILSLPAGLLSPSLARAKARARIVQCAQTSSRLAWRSTFGTDGLRQAVRSADDARNDYHTLPPY